MARNYRKERGRQAMHACACGCGDHPAKWDAEYIRGHRPRTTLAQRLYAEGRTIRDENGCLIWQGSITPGGYGQLLDDQRRRLIGAHKAAWQIAHGPVPMGMYVCHHCDVRSCVEVTHLFLGTPSDNVQDMIAKGRHKTARGMENHNARLTREQVDEIIRRYRKWPGSPRGYRSNAAELAQEFGVAKPYVTDLVRGRWRKTA